MLRVVTVAVTLDVRASDSVIYPGEGYHKGQPYVNDPKVKSFIQWTKTLKDNIVLQKTVVGGHYRYPHPPRKCAQSTADASGEEKTHHSSFKHGFRSKNIFTQPGNGKFSVTATLALRQLIIGYCIDCKM